MLKYRSDTEAILNNKEKNNLFVDNKFSSSENHCYLMFDSGRVIIIKVDTTYNGYTDIWETYLTNSNLTFIQSKSDKFRFFLS